MARSVTFLCILTLKWVNFFKICLPLISFSNCCRSTTLPQKGSINQNSSIAAVDCNPHQRILLCISCRTCCALKCISLTRIFYTYITRTTSCCIKLTLQVANLLQTCYTATERVNVVWSVNENILIEKSTTLAYEPRIATKSYV